MQHGTIVGQRFEIRELAGSGAMGAVYRALDLTTQRPLAVKLLSALGAADLARFEREATVLERLGHPNIVRFVDRGVTDQGRPFLVLEWLEGETLSSRLGQVIPTLEETIALVRMLARAVAHAHAHGIVHRDIKPANVFLLGPGFADPRLLDFGVARITQGASEMTRTGMALGTPVYMAPEQARGRKDVDARADIYALGCLLFECVTGRVPFEGDDVMAVLAKVLFEEPPRLSSLVPAAPDSLDELTARLLEKDPARRPQSAEELDALLSSIETELSASVPELRGGRSTRPPRPLTTREQKLVAVVAVAPRTDGSSSAGTAATLAAGSIVPTLRLASEARGFGATFSPLANGSCIAVLEGEGAASDLAFRAARCALAFRAHCADLPIALVMGRATTGRVPVGEVIDRVSELVRASLVSADAMPRAVVVDELAARLLDRRFGIAYGEEVTMLLDERDQPEHKSILLGKPTPFVGRARELRMLRELFEETVTESASSVALVTGAAGVGKSRLVGEWLESLATRPADVEVWLGRSDPVAAGSPLGTIASAVRSAARVVRGDAASIAQRKLVSRVEQDVRGPDALRVAEFLGEIIGAPFDEDASDELEAARTDPTLMGDQLRRAFERFVDAVTAARPLVIALEDTQWGDAASVRLVEAALRQAKRRPLLVCVIGRLDAASALMGLASFRGALHLAIGELPRRACRDFVDAVLPGLGEPTQNTIVERAGGNAFFLEELVRYVAEQRANAEPPPSGGPRSTVRQDFPSTVIAMLQARLQALPSHARRFMRGASIFGHAFWPEGVQHLLGETSSQESFPRVPSVDTIRESVETLLAEELIERRAPSRFPGKDELCFRQGLVRDAAYAMLTERDRSAGHRLAGEWLEAAGELEPLVLGEHLQRGASGVRAARWFTAAASKALDGHDFNAAIELVERGREAMGSEAPADILGALLLIEAEARRWSGDLAAAERAARLALEMLPLGSSAWFHASAQLGATAGVRSDFRPVALWRERIASGPCEERARAARVNALCVVGRRLFQLGDYDAANDLVDAVQREYAALAPELDARTEAEVHRLMGARARHSSDVANDLKFYGAAVDAFERAGDARGACNTLVSLAFSNIQLGDHSTARTELERALSEASRLGLANVVTRAHQNLSLVLLAEGKAREALDLALRVIDEAKSRGDERFEGWTSIYASRAAMACGDIEAARTHADAAAPLLSGTPPAYAGALAARALALVALGDPVEADINAGEAHAILSAYDGIEEFESLVHLAGVRTALALADTARARALLAAAMERLEERGKNIADPDARLRFLHQVSENDALMKLAKEAPDDPSESEHDSWSADAFREDASIVVERLVHHLDHAMGGQAQVTRGFPSPEAMLAAFDAPFADGPKAQLGELLDRVLAASPHQHNPRYVGHQVSSSVPRAALLSLVGAVLNNGMAAFESGPAITVLERRVIEWMVGLLAWDHGGGVLTSGGSLGNLTALLAARQAKAGFDVKAGGLAGREPLGLLVSEQVHYSIERAAQIMGMGRDAVFPVPTDERYRLLPSAIDAAFQRAQRAGIRPIALVASAGATGTGSVDPLNRIADECERLGLWLHVDGAHGASALLSPRYGPELAGVERADSLVWDAHKMMSMPALVTAVLFRNGRAPYETFAQEAAYLFQGDPDGRWFDIGLRTIECTKPLLAVPLYGRLATLGIGVFRNAVEHAYGLARRFAQSVEDAPDFELACMPDSNIVCFRHLLGEDLDARQRHVVAELRRQGHFYCVMTTLRDDVHLRISIMNPLTTDRHLAELLDAIRSVEA